MAKDNKEKSSINSTVIITAVIIVLGALFITLMIKPSTPGQTVSVSGNAKATVAPDEVAVYILVETKSESAKTAKNENSEITDRVIKNLVESGFSEDEIETENFNMYESWNWINEEKQEKEFVAAHTLKLTTDDFENVGEVVDVAVAAGAMINSINFDLSLEERNKIKKEVLAQASQDAKAKAEAIAEGLGKSLGRIVSISTADYGFETPIFYARDEAATFDVKSIPIAIQTNNIDLTASVQAVYEIK